MLMRGALSPASGNYFRHRQEIKCTLYPCSVFSATNNGEERRRGSVETLHEKHSWLRLTFSLLVIFRYTGCVVFPTKTIQNCRVVTNGGDRNQHASPPPRMLVSLVSHAGFLTFLKDITTRNKSLRHPVVYASVQNTLSGQLHFH